MAIEIVEFLIEHGDLPVRYVNVYQRVPVPLPPEVVKRMGPRFEFLTACKSLNFEDAAGAWLDFDKVPPAREDLDWEPKWSLCNHYITI